MTVAYHDNASHKLQGAWKTELIESCGHEDTRMPSSSKPDKVRCWAMSPYGNAKKANFKHVGRASAAMQLIQGI